MKVIVIKSLGFLLLAARLAVAQPDIGAQLLSIHMGGGQRVAKLLRTKDVLDDLDVTPSQRSRLKDVSSRSEIPMSELIPGDSEAGPAKREYIERTLKIAANKLRLNQKQVASEIQEILSEKQLDRLRQLYLQDIALRNTRELKSGTLELGLEEELTQEQRNDLYDAFSKANKKCKSEYQKFKYNAHFGAWTEVLGMKAGRKLFGQPLKHASLGEFKFDYSETGH